MKKQATLTQKQKDTILVGLQSISETFRVMVSSKAEKSTDYFLKVTIELLETYKSFIRMFPAAWRNTNRPEAPGYVAAAMRCQRNIRVLEHLHNNLVSAKLFPGRIEKITQTPTSEVMLYNVWVTHNWAFKCFAGIVPPASRIMTPEEYDAKYSSISEMLYKMNFKEETNE